jgi:hypothetical protein
MLIKLYEATTSTVPPSPDGISSVVSGWYAARYDAVVLLGGSHLAGTYKIFRDGSIVRMANGPAFSVHGFSIDDDLPITIPTTPASPLLNDPIGMKYNPSKLSSLTYTGTVASGHTNPVVYKGYYYTVSGATVTKRNLATGAAV